MFVDAVVVIVFMVQAPRGGGGVCLRGNFQATTPPRLAWILSAAQLSSGCAFVSTTPRRQLGQRIADVCIRHPLLSYFLLTYAISWSFFVPFVYLWRVVLDGQFKWWVIVFLPGGYGPQSPRSSWPASSAEKRG